MTSPGVEVLRVDGVEFRRDGPSRAAKQLIPGYLKIILHDESSLPFLQAFTSADKPDVKIFLKDLRSLATTAPCGVSTTYNFGQCNLYLKFKSNADLRTFHDTVNQISRSGGFVSLATAANSKLRRSPRLTPKKIESQTVTENSSETQENGTAPPSCLERRQKEVVVKLPTTDSENVDRTDFLFGLVGNDGFHTSKSTRAPTAKKITTKQATNSRSLMANSEGRSKLGTAPDKENQNRTPQKVPSQVETEKRTPLADRRVSSTIPSSTSTSIAILHHNGSDSGESVTPKEIIPGLDNFPSLQHHSENKLSTNNSKRLLTDYYASDIQPKRLKIYGSDVDACWKQTTRLSYASLEKPHWKGFSNIGNTCYMNSILQALFALAPFAKELLKSYHYYEGKIPGDWLFHGLPMLLGVKDSDNHDLKVDLLRAVKNAISTSATRFLGNEQHDAHEFLAQILDQLKEEINRIGTIFVAATVPPPNPVQSNFEFCVCHFIECQSCHNVVRKDEYFNDLPLVLPLTRQDNDNPLSLQRLFDAFFKDESVSYRCEKCNGDASITSHKFTKLPRILTLHLKRYVFDNVIAVDMKVATTIAFPRFLSLHHLCAETVVETSLLSESTKKVVPKDISRLSPKLEQSGTPSSARKRLFLDEPDKKFSFRRPGAGTIYNTRSTTTVTSSLLSEQDTLEEVLERSKRETGPPDDDVKFESDTYEAVLLSLKEQSGGADDIDPFLNDTFSFPKTHGENGFEDEEDEEMRLNAEDGHLQPAFRLCGVVNHVGTRTASGHYVSDVYDTESSTWRSYDDSHVSETTEDNVQRNRQKTAYIFFYMAKSVLDDVKSGNNSSMSL